MDGYKRPFRGSKVYVRKKGEEDDTLVNLYKESEFAKEESDTEDGFDEDASTEQSEEDEWNNEDDSDSDIDDSLTILAKLTKKISQ